MSITRIVVWLVLALLTLAGAAPRFVAYRQRLFARALERRVREYQAAELRARRER